MALLSEPVEIALYSRGFLYRIWDDAGVCLYVGKTRQAHPEMRLMAHRIKSWWHRVARADYVVVPGCESLEDAEKEMIRELQPVYNIQGKYEDDGRIYNDKAAQVLDWLDKNQVPLSWGRPRVRTFMIEHEGPPCSNDILNDLIYIRKNTHV